MPCIDFQHVKKLPLQFFPHSLPPAQLRWLIEWEAGFSRTAQPTAKQHLQESAIRPAPAMNKTTSRFTARCRPASSTLIQLLTLATSSVSSSLRKAPVPDR